MSNPSGFPLIILAAGKSSRMGSPKGLVPYKGNPWLFSQLEAYGKLGGGRVVLVLGFDSDKYLEAIPWLLQSCSEYVYYQNIQIKTVISPNPEFGQFSSIQSGIKEIMSYDSAPRGVFLTPIDIPIADVNILRILMLHVLKGAQACIPYHEERGGHPVALHHDFLKSLERLLVSGDESRLDLQIKKLDPSLVIAAPANDPRVVMNLNTPAEFESFAGTSW
ncbi:MAG: NTP transferase domain-containing protein [Bacteriovoracaceae bacterium]|jgi:CTP:molybdopterin cytidylyltransferase MocA|nr:NTP transferase domain-containing protein [Bacteriovoracaceae bacterium]